jgi:hypothetical protein
MLKLRRFTSEFPSRRLGSLWRHSADSDIQSHGTTTRVESVKYKGWSAINPLPVLTNSITTRSVVNTPEHSIMVYFAPLLLLTSLCVTVSGLSAPVHEKRDGIQPVLSGISDVNNNYKVLGAAVQSYKSAAQGPVSSALPKQPGSELTSAPFSKILPPGYF